MDEHDDPFDEIAVELRSTPLWILAFVGLGLMGVLGVLGMLLACATPGPLPPLPPVPDISGPPLMAPADAGSRCPPSVSAPHGCTLTAAADGGHR